MSNAYIKADECRLTAIYDLLAYVMERCPREFDDEMNERFLSALRSISAPAPISGDGVAPGEEALYSDPLGRNYLIAQCSVLLLFANRIQKAAANPHLQEVPKLVEALWNDLGKQYAAFFGEP